MDKENRFSLFVKFALVLMIFSIIMLFIVDFKSAEFYVLIFSIIVLLAFVVFSIFKIRKDIKRGK